jgi:hypothetical protein
MNISPLTIYLWQLADKLITSTAVVTGIACVAMAFTLMFCTFPDEGVREFARSKVRLSTLAFLSLFIFGSLIPSSKTIAMMIIIPEIAHSKVVQQDLPDIYNAAVKALKDQLAK